PVRGHRGDDAQPEPGAVAEGAAVPRGAAGERPGGRRRAVRYPLLRGGGAGRRTAAGAELPADGTKRTAEEGPERRPGWRRREARRRVRSLTGNRVAEFDHWRAPWNSCRCVTRGRGSRRGWPSTPDSYSTA